MEYPHQVIEEGADTFGFENGEHFFWFLKNGESTSSWYLNNGARTFLGFQIGEARFFGTKET